MCNSDIRDNFQAELSEARLMCVACNMSIPDNILLSQGMRELRPRLPRGWMVSEPKAPRVPGIDAAVKLTASDRRTCEIGLEAKTRLEPKGVRDLLEATAEARQRGPLIVVGRYLSERTRERLRNGGVGYLDLTGNIRIAVSNPGLYIETQGAAEDPDREERKARSMRGAKAGRIVRLLLDRREPPGVCEIAALTKIDAGYVSRVLALLDSEALITRVGRGRMQSVDWPALLRSWAQEAPIESRGTARTYLDPRGLSSLMARLAKSDERYVVTGGLAAAAFAPIAPPRLAVIWMRDVTAAAERLRLRPAASGANVLLVEPHDDAVFEGATQRDDIWYAVPSQIAADLLSSPGRGPAEGEELIQWMQANEEKWRQ